MSVSNKLSWFLAFCLSILIFIGIYLYFQVNVMPSVCEFRTINESDTSVRVLEFSNFGMKGPGCGYLESNWDKGTNYSDGAILPEETIVYWVYDSVDHLPVKESYDDFRKVFSAANQHKIHLSELKRGAGLAEKSDAIEFVFGKDHKWFVRYKKR